MRQRILSFAKYAVFCLVTILMGFLSVVTFISTAYFKRENFSAESIVAEHVYYRTDSLILNLLVIGLFLVMLFLLNRKFDLEAIPTKLLAVVAVFYTLFVSVLWISVSHTYPQADQETVSCAGYLMSLNNFLFLQPGYYMQINPHQLGLAAVMEALYRLGKAENWKYFMYLTAISNGFIIYFLYRITALLFHNRRICNLVLLLSMGCVQIFLYTTFLYGITLGLALSLGAFLLLLLFFEKEKIGYALLAAVLLGISILVKSNYNICLIAITILLCYKGLEVKKIQPVLLIFVFISMSSLMGHALTSFYEFRSGMEISSGMPKSLYIAMGMQEGERAEGWFNDFNIGTFVNSDCDISKSDAIAKKSIQESLKRFWDDPAYALQFYYKKIVSQWNEPTYEALWVNRHHKGEFSKIVQSIYDGKLYTVLYEYMNIYQSLIYCMALVCLLIYRNCWSIEQLFFFIVVLGGFYFHILWEAKSQYIYPYFLLLLPYAAAGMSGSLDFLSSKIKNKTNKISVKAQ